MNTKAQGILNGAKWVEETYGRDALCEVLRGCSPAVRECLASAIAINWHPLDELVEFVTAADRLLGRGDGKVAEEIGAAGARANLKGVIARMAFLLATPDYLMRRVAALYLQFNDQGEMLLTSLSPGVGEIELRGRPKVYPIHCSIITGWARAASVALGAADPVVTHGSCIGRGLDRCTWTSRWTAVRQEGPGHRLPHPRKPVRP